MAAQKKTPQEGQIEFYSFFPTVADKPCICPVKIRLPFNSLCLKNKSSLKGRALKPSKPYQEINTTVSSSFNFSFQK